MWDIEEEEEGTPEMDPSETCHPTRGRDGSTEIGVILDFMIQQHAEDSHGSQDGGGPTLKIERAHRTTTLSPEVLSRRKTPLRKGLNS